MRNYKGISNDIPIGKFKYIVDGKQPHEVSNFLPYEGFCYGYAPVNNKTININKLGTNNAATKVDNVLVIWTATSPDGGRFVIGWYESATVYRHLRTKILLRERGFKEEIIYSVFAPEKLCYLVPLDQRTFLMPTMKKGYPGISSSFFPKKTTPWLDTLLHYISSIKIPAYLNAPSIPRGKDFDPDFKSMIEREAVRIVWIYYESQGFQVISVEKDNVGWDLEARLNQKTLYLEVKGLSGSDSAVEVTPNEYRAMKSMEHRSSYRLCIINKPHISNEMEMRIFNYDMRIDAWVSQYLEALHVKESIAARLFI